MSLRAKIDQVEKELTAVKVAGPLDAILRAVLLPQLRGLPDAAEADVRQGVREIVAALTRIFELDKPAPDTPHETR